mmetsp:Transcript_10210/g.17105  ORF Transcript_10210/g.17105 Transcript_10210/m.17105 type:complete len:210 (+) Transcript_10210:87-716(+)
MGGVTGFVKEKLRCASSACALRGPHRQVCCLVHEGSCFTKRSCAVVETVCNTNLILLTSGQTYKFSLNSVHPSSTARWPSKQGNHSSSSSSSITSCSGGGIPFSAHFCSKTALASWSSCKRVLSPCKITLFDVRLEDTAVSISRTVRPVTPAAAAALLCSSRSDATCALTSLSCALPRCTSSCNRDAASELLIRFSCARLMSSLSSLIV